MRTIRHQPLDVTISKTEPPLRAAVASGRAVPYSTNKPIPRGWELCCPFCECWRMRIGKLGELPGFYCRNGAGLLPPYCGKFLSNLAASVHKSLYIVEEG